MIATFTISMISSVPTFLSLVFLAQRQFFKNESPSSALPSLVNFVPHLICSKDLRPPPAAFLPTAISGFRLVLGDLVCHLEFCGCFLCQGTLDAGEPQRSSAPHPRHWRPFQHPLPKVSRPGAPSSKDRLLAVHRAAGVTARPPRVALT